MFQYNIAQWKEVGGGEGEKGEELEKKSKLIFCLYKKWQQPRFRRT